MLFRSRLMDTKKVVATHEFKLEERIANSKYRQSFNSSDVIYLLMPDRFANANEGLDTHPDAKEATNRESFPVDWPILGVKDLSKEEETGKHEKHADAAFAQVLIEN